MGTRGSAAWEALRHHLRKAATGPPLHEDDLSLGTSEDSSPRERPGRSPTLETHGVHLAEALS